MKRIWTVIGVADVTRSFNWYRSLFGQPESAPAHDYFGQILDSDGTVLICLHSWGAHDHPSLSSPERAEPGNGLLLFFRVDGFRRGAGASPDPGRPARRGAPVESGDPDARVRAPRSRRILRHGQCACLNARFPSPDQSTEHP